MHEHDEQLERLVTRRLDGELSDEEQLELNKRLIRDPEAQACLEDGRRIDALAEDLLQQVCCASGGSRGRLGSGSSRRRAWWAVIPTAAAACLALWLVQPPPSVNDGPDELLAGAVPEAAIPEAIRPAPRFVDWGPTAPPRETGTHLNYYGLFDEARERLYLLEIKRTTTTQRNQRGPAGTGQAQVRFASGEL